MNTRKTKHKRLLPWRKRQYVPPKCG